MKKILSALGIIFTLISSVAVADHQTANVTVTNTAFSGGAVASGITAPFFNSTSMTNGFQINGIPFVRIFGTQNISPYGNCTNACDTLIGIGAGANLPGTDYLTTAVGFQACGTTTLSRPELTCFGWNAGGNGTGANFIFNSLFGINVLGACTDTCQNNAIFGLDAARDQQIFNQNVVMGVGTANNLTGLNRSVLLGYAAFTGKTGAATSADIIAVGNNSMLGTNLTGGLSDDIAIGSSTLAGIVSGSHDYVMGLNAGTGCTTCDQNILIGWSVAQNGTTTATMSQNTFVGHLIASGASAGNAGGLANSVFGYGSGILLNGSSNSNVIIGSGSGTAITSGSRNIIICKGCGNTITSGNDNLIINANPPAGTTNNYTGVGGMRGYTITPTLFSGAGVGATISGNTFLMKIVVGTAASSTITLTMPLTPGTQWACDANDETTNTAALAQVKQTANTTTSVSISAFSSIQVAASFVANDNIYIKCLAM